MTLKELEDACVKARKQGAKDEDLVFVGDSPVSWDTSVQVKEAALVDVQKLHTEQGWRFEHHCTDRIFFLMVHGR